MKKFIPILFQTPMVQALDHKTMTRRTRGLKTINEKPDSWHFSHNRGDGYYCFKNEGGNTLNPLAVKCPYGKPGDVLWVRESLLHCSHDEFLEGMNSRTVYKASIHEDWFLALKEKHPSYKWTPSIHMPAKAARIFLEVTNVRVERLHDITEKDSKAEGVYQFDDGYYRAYHLKGGSCVAAKDSFLSLWIHLNGKQSHDANPWLWVVEFKKIEKPAAWDKYLQSLALKPLIKAIEKKTGEKIECVTGHFNTTI